MLWVVRTLVNAIADVLLEANQRRRRRKRKRKRRRKRLEVVEKADGIGWGYHDGIADAFSGAFPPE